MLDGFLDGASSGRSLVLTGGAGIGKTTLWEAGMHDAAERGLRVLSARASSAEAQLSFATLIDLCDGVDTGSLIGLAPVQRSALEVALLRAEPESAPPEPHAISLGFLNLLRALAADATLLVAVDDIQWLDQPSADALAFVALRLDGEPLSFLLARRGEEPSAFERALGRGAMERLEVGPLSLGAARRVLAERLELTMSRQQLRRVVEITLGNPLFILELGRALLQNGLPESAEDIPMPGGIEEILGTRVASLEPLLRRLLVAVALSADLRVSELGAVGGGGPLEAAIEAGLLLVAGDRVRAAHPLLAAAAKSGSPARERREVHLALAAAVSDPELRAEHLALASEREDGALAETIARAAAGAGARGARRQAVNLAEHALRLTPSDSQARPERVLDLAACLETAGELTRMTELLTRELAFLPAGGHRAHAWLMPRRAPARGRWTTWIGCWIRRSPTAPKIQVCVRPCWPRRRRMPRRAARRTWRSLRHGRRRGLTPRAWDRRTRHGPRYTRSPGYMQSPVDRLTNFVAPTDRRRTVPPISPGHPSV